ncbi:MAG TPA: FHA domain-containing protein [Vicinamibacteria bacterium]|nr:FHA domain-containing protein [Vicinamibacteria bacterium]
MKLKSLLGGVMDGELGHPDLLRRVVDGISKLKRHADRGVEVLPPEVEVHITVGEGSVQVIERFVTDPAFDREVEAALRNRLVRAREDRMPVRRYYVKAGKRTQVSVKETPPRSYQLCIEGGDRSGTAVPLPGEKRVFLVGRGPWHGDEQQVANDVVVSESEKAISRRAARVHRAGGTFELESLDQSEALVVSRPDGQRLRPALAASGRVPVQPGDVIEFTDGAKTVLTVRLEEA